MEKTVKDLIDWLENFPQEAVIEFAVQRKAPLYESFGPVEFVSPALEKNDWNDCGWSFDDYRDNKFTKEDSPHFGKCYLRFGEID